jgi:iron complex outermembrane recepter protein
VDAVYPPAARASSRDVTVVLLVTIGRDGAVGDVTVAQSGGAEFDEAAIRAVKAWTFVPARQGDEPVASRIRVPFEFHASRSEPEPEPVPPPPPNAQPKPAAVAPEQHPEAIEVTVEGERELRREERSVSDFRLRRDVLEAAPSQEGADVLRRAPGVYMGRGEGAAIAHSYMLRGFDAEHGQDIEFRVGGLPINLPSHLHGQGYADLGFLIAETVQELYVREGVYDPRQGDFAVAGSIDIELGMERRGLLFKSGYGSFGTFRQLMAWAPEDAEPQTFGAVQYSQSDGFGENRAGRAVSATVQQNFGSGAMRYRALGIAYAARADLAGVLRSDDVEAGRVCFYCVYPYPTARAQNALANRLMVGLFAEYRGEQDNGEIGCGSVATTSGCRATSRASRRARRLWRASRDAAI